MKAREHGVEQLESKQKALKVSKNNNKKVSLHPKAASHEYLALEMPRYIQVTA